MVQRHQSPPGIIPELHRLCWELSCDLGEGYQGASLFLGAGSDNRPFNAPVNAPPTSGVPVTVSEYLITDDAGVLIFPTDAIYPGELGAGPQRGNIDVGIQLAARTRSLRIIYDLIAWLYAYPADVIRKQGERDPTALARAIANGAIRHGVIHGPITLDRSPPSAELGGALAVINATLACDLEYPSGFISDHLSHTDAITITYINGMDQSVLREATITARDGGA